VANFGTAYIDIAGNFAPLEAEIKGIASSSIGKRMETLGKSLTKSLTLPLVGVGGIAAKMSLDFNRSMSLISTQAGGTAKEVKKLKGEVLDLAKASKFSPNELATALFHVESSGYRGAKAIQTLNAAQKLATVGNSELDSTTYALVSAIKALGHEGGKTSKVAAELNAIVGHGDIRMEEMTSSLSTGIIPAAKTVGLGLRDVGAAMDVMTARGIPAQRAAYNLRMTFSKLSAPTKAGAEALEEVGISSEQLAETMRSEGLGEAVKELAEHLDSVSKIKAGEIISTAFGGGRTSSGIETLIQNVGELGKKYTEIAGSVGDYNRQVREAEANPKVKLEKAWSNIQVALVEIGNALVPVIVPAFEKLAGLISEIGEKFSELSTGSKTLVVDMAFAVAALGPGLTIAGKLVGTFETLATVIKKAAVAMGLFQTAEEGAAAVAAGSVTATAEGVASKVAPWTPASPWLGSGAQRAAAAEESRRAILGDSMSSFNLAAVAAPEAASVASTGRLAATAAKIGGVATGLAAAAPEAAPWLALGAAVVAAGVGMVALYRSSQKVREAVAPIGNAAVKGFGEIKAQIAPLERAISGLGKAFEGHEGLIGAVKDLAAEFKGPINAVEAVFTGGLLRSITNVSGQIADVIKGIGRSFSGSIQVIQGAVEIITGILTLKFGKAWQGVKDIFTGSLKTVVGFVRATASPLIGAVGTLSGGVHSAFGDMWTKIEGVFKDGINAVIGLLNSMIGLVNKLPFVSIGPVGDVGSTAKPPLLKSPAELHHRATGGIVPGGGEGDSFRTVVPPGTFILNKKATRAFGFAEGGAVPVMLEPGEKVFHPDEVRQYGLHTLQAANAAVPRFSIGGVASSIGSDITSLPGKALGAVEGLGGAGVNAILNSLPDPAASLPKWLQGFGAYLKKQLVAWVEGKDKKFGSLTSALSGGTTASALQFAQYMIQAGFPRTQKVIAEGLGTIDAESGFRKNNAQGPSGHIGPWAESPAFGSVRTREDPLGSTEAAFRVGWSPTRSFVPAWTTWESGEAGGTGIDRAGQFMGIAAQALGGTRGKKAAGHAAAKALPHFAKGGLVGMAKGGSIGGRDQNIHQNILHEIAYLSGHYSPNSLSPWNKDFASTVSTWNHLPRDIRLYNRDASEAFLRAKLPDGFGVRTPSSFITKGLKQPNEPVRAAKGALIGIAPDMDASADERKRFQALRDQGILKLAKGGSTGKKEKKGPSVLERMLTRMKELTGVPYPNPDQHFGLQQNPAELDCSAAVSNVLWAGGLLNTEETSGPLESFGKPGVGKFSIFANAGHAFIEALGRFWGTSVDDAGAGGLGYHPAPSASYLSEFVARHVSESALGNAPEGVTGTTSKPSVPKQVTGPFTKHKAGQTSPAGGTYGQKITAQYKAQTTKLSFGSAPTTLEGCTKELRHLQERLLPEYKAALRNTKDPETKRAIEANVKLIEARISLLRRTRARLAIQAKAKKALTKIGEAAEFAKWTAPNVGIFAKREAEFNLAEELAGQSVELEPEEPANVTGDWVNGVLAPYVGGTESPAYARVLGAEGSWRNAIIEAEGVAQARIEAWGTRIGDLKERITEIYGYKQTKPQAWAKQKELIPGLKAQIKALGADILKTHTETLPEWEQGLGGVQGLGRGHELLASLPSTPTGAFGGNIFSTQEMIKGLGLKVPQATANLSEPAKNTEREALLEQLLLQDNQRLAIQGALEPVLSQFKSTYPVLPPYGGKAHTGAIVPGPSSQEKTMVVKGREGIFTEEQMAALTPAQNQGGAPVIESLVIHPDGSATMRFEGRDFETAVQEVVRGTRKPLSSSGAGQAWRP
jgi:TP901 family phage tail tape measure protein